VGAVCTLLLHAQLITPLLAGIDPESRYRRPVIEGSGANVSGGAEESPNLILIDLSAISLGEDSRFSDLPKADGLADDAQLKVVSGDSNPAFSRLNVDDDGEQAAPPETALETAGRSKMYGRYVGQVVARIERMWHRPASPPGVSGFDCLVRVDQDRDGNVKAVELVQCDGSPEWQHSLVRAIESASPLSAPPEPSVFANQLVLKFFSPASDAS
jgi:hypothetical protein